jgi:DNA polymerase I-like protein with 3'-5' exonuclease and polymerase domains
MNTMIVAFDTETFLINQRGKATTKTVPRLVCLSARAEGREAELYDREGGVQWFLDILENEEVDTIVGHNLPFDLLVMLRAVEEVQPDRYPAAFEAVLARYEEGGFSDTQVLERLIQIERNEMGRNSLSDLSKRYRGNKLGGKKGPDVWRLRYNELDGIPLAKWPEAAREYALEDARATLEIFFAQLESCPRNESNLAFQCMSHFALAMISAWGLKVDQPWVQALVAFYRSQAATAKAALEEFGVIQKGRLKQAEVARIIERGFAIIGEETPLTSTGRVSTASKTMDTLIKAGFDDPRFEHLTAYKRANKFIATYLEPFVDAKDEPLCPRYNVLVDSGRISSSGPNITNVPSRITHTEKAALKAFKGETELERVQAGIVAGADIRGCVVPREGHVFVVADYAAIEMAGLAQVKKNLFGVLPALGESINADEDQHLRVLASWLERSYREVEEAYNLNPDAEIEIGGELQTLDYLRFLCKSANYGFAGGAAAATWQDYVFNFGVVVDLKTAEMVREAWFTAWPEMREYFRHISSLRAPNDQYILEQHGPGGQTYGWRRRSCPSYTSAANSYFQGIVADGAKLAAWLLLREQARTDGPLVGSRTSIFVHDEFILEVPEDRADVAGEALVRCMVEGMQVFLPDITVKADYRIQAERWSK